MHPHLPPTFPGLPPTPRHTRDAAQVQHVDSFRKRLHSAQRAFLVANAVPYSVGILLSSFTDIPGVRISGHVTLGMVWVVAQCVVFVGTAWVCEIRSARSSDPTEEPLAATEVSGAAPVGGLRWWTR